MNIKALANDTGLSQVAIRYLIAEGIVNEPLDEYHLFFLSDLKKIWGKQKFVKLQIADYNQSKRARLVFSANLNKIESYILHRWIAHYGNRCDKINLHVNQVVDETLHYLNLPLNMKKGVTSAAYKMRQKARNIVYRHSADLTQSVNAITNPTIARLEKRITSQNNSRSKLKITQNDIFGF